MLQRLIYCSDREDGGDLAALLATAAHRNKGRGVTGLLIADARSFLQVLEGERATLAALFQTIARDPRHSRVTLVSVEDIRSQSYPAWGMSQIADVAKIAAMWWKTGAERPFDPHAMSAQEVQNFLRLASFELMSAGPTP
ncbi:MAG: BLUF domain-containing protein [Hyphomonadaceae bacterium]